ncbi:cation transporting ATPase C-terminal domain-containing protein, partial [Acinetobacter baumannii]|uniref:cation transporting ATPase C-terminal domain-containing protein n=1 Tax=Acinetobacter baumannii TaxID=470 RepID=UPI001AECA646
MAFSTLIWSRTLQTFPARSNSQSAIKAGLFSNKIVIIAVGLCTVLYTVTLLPGLRSVFSIPNTFGLNQIGISVGLALGAIVLMEITKLFLNKK